MSKSGERNAGTVEPQCVRCISEKDMCIYLQEGQMHASSENATFLCDDISILWPSRVFPQRTLESRCMHCEPEWETPICIHSKNH